MLAVFTASCAERMAQLFTGQCGDDPSRAAEVATFLKILDELWDLGLLAVGFSAHVEGLQAFAELATAADEEPLSEIDDIYVFNSVLCRRYATLYRATLDPEEAVRCAHVSLSALWQLDRNVDINSSSEARSLDREVGRERLLVVQSRL